MKELEDAVEKLRLEMLLSHPTLAENLRSLEAHLLHERDATLNHIRHIKALRHETEAMIRGELEALRELLVPTELPPPVPSIEERFTRPRFIGGETIQ